ncbi:MAG: MG2 domain-containing protein, partial [Planctomycetota bacterium]|nr:MG2 domain-containing protein [Planctomycetota bacterium]
WRMEPDDSKKDESGTYALHTLSEDETIARLATGVKRFKLPDEFNYIKIYKEVAADRETLSPQGISAMRTLAQIFENRRQYPKAAEYCRKLVAELLEMRRDKEVNNWQKRLDQIVGNWGRFEPIMTQPAGKGASVEFRFRNGKQASFTARKIKVEKLLDDVKDYIKSRHRHAGQGRLDHQKFQIGNLGYRLVNKNEKQYIGHQVASWEVELEPRDNHFDRRITVATPLVSAGAYLLTAKMDDGNTSKIILWINDAALVEKSLAERNLYYLADSRSGRPIANANLEFFGFKMRHRRNNNYEINIQNFAEHTDKNGQVITDARQQPRGYQWLITARGSKGRFAYLGFSNVWYGRYYDREYKATKVYTITDRPVYRPKQKVQYKFWIRHAQYDQPDMNYFADKPFTVEIHNPKGERIVEKKCTTDEYGGITGELELPEDVLLGVYRLNIKRPPGTRFRGPNGGTFRVEEYKKPEFEVTVEAPKDPVALGETITATIRAKYYFGSPVTDAKVKYKVTRTPKSSDWFPIGPWDWLYGPGYWWFGYDYDWFPGWRNWGCLRPRSSWWHRSHAPPELVAEREVQIGSDGTFKVEIDTAPAKAMHPDQDHSYTVTAEITDLSRRTIVGTGNVLVSRKPFSVYAWLNRGYYRVGDVMRADFAARRLDGKPVAGEGEVTLLRVTYPGGTLTETHVQQWPLATDVTGKAKLKLTAGKPGQYRLSYKVTDAKQHTIEGGYVFTIIGQGFQSGDFRFNNIELVPDRRDYQPGDKVNLQINTNREGSTVLLFLRPANGVYLPPQMIHLDGKSTTRQIAVAKKDMPNFFVEAVTVADGKVYREAKEICVPPEKRVLSVDVKPSSEAYKPGEKATVDVKLTDFRGRPFIGSTVIAIYDKSVEYISGGSNVPSIKEFFWKWRRSHHPRGNNNLTRSGRNLVLPNKPGMRDLGVFG